MARTKKAGPSEVVEVKDAPLEEAKVTSEEIKEPKWSVFDTMPKGPKRFFPVYAPDSQSDPIVLKHWIDLVSIDSDEHWAVVREQMQNPKPADLPVADRVTENWWEEIAGCVVAWDEEFYGPYSKDHARALFKNHGFTWCREQVARYVTELKNFI